MGKTIRVGMAALVAAPFIGVISSSAAVAEPQTCTVNTARSAANEGDYGTLCGCSHVTQGFVTHLQRRSDLPSILQNTAAQCPGLTDLLIDLPTASISNASSGEGRNSDPASRSAAAGDDENPDANSGGGTSPGGGGGTPGNGGDAPSDGGDSPGDGGGGKPGDGGDKPGKGGGKGGHGGDKPGKGGGKGGHGGDKPGKGGGAKGNNGGGNGPEGASPGRGKNANNDEG
ncbi:hypothetical protein [uncultured Ruegeria sp.]|uniref:hypothetical protein n=1 Tax=uncultured Ruegeria sp. TaxID=259304 RepID=UPI002619B502|nr:hypothetical protein [uncultured Ruegeria sp.]